MSDGNSSTTSSQNCECSSKTNELTDTTTTDRENAKRDLINCARDERNKLIENPDQREYDRVINCHKQYAEKLIKADHPGAGADLIRDLAKALNSNNQPVAKVANCFIWIADQLFNVNLYGWAASRYYEAAMAYINKGLFNKAKHTLMDANHKFTYDKDDFWKRYFEKHVAIFKNEQTNFTLILDLLILDFRELGRLDWVNSCKNGKSKPKSKKNS
jgi:hypothetical protein